MMCDMPSTQKIYGNNLLEFSLENIARFANACNGNSSESGIDKKMRHLCSFQIISVVSIPLRVLVTRIVSSRAIG